MKELIRVRVQYASRQQCCKTHKRPLPFYLTDKSRLYKVNTVYFIVDSFGGLVVIMLASGTPKFAGSDLAEAVRFLRA